MKTLRVCVVTATRAEYSLLYFVMKKLQLDPSIELQIVVTGAHLSPEFGHTYKVLESDGFDVSNKVEILLSSDTRIGTASSLALCTLGVSQTLERLSPDIVVLCGDRYEMLGAAQSAMLLRIPIAHIAGGDSTIGAFDESIRHSITKMSHLHFVTNSDALQRVKQLGENPSLVFNVGSPALEHIRTIKFLDRNELQAALNFEFLAKNLLITFHPETIAESSDAELRELLKSLKKMGPDVGLIFTQPNADPGSRSLDKILDEFIAKHKNAAKFTNLGQLKYLSLVKQVDAVVGNSSSGLYEIPSLKKPTVNIGARQEGRMKADSVIDCSPHESKISDAINQALGKDCSQAINPYEGANSSSNIVSLIKQHANPELLKKKFFDLEFTPSK